MADVLTALSTALTSVSTNFFSALEDILPIALGIVAAVLVVTLGIRVFRRIVARA